MVDLIVDLIVRGVAVLAVIAFFGMVVYIAVNILDSFFEVKK